MQLEQNFSVGMSFEEKGVFFPLKKVLSDYLSFTKCYFFFLEKGKEAGNLQVSSHISTPFKVKARKIINI